MQRPSTHVQVSTAGLLDIEREEDKKGMASEESDTEPDEGARPIGYGPRGEGDPLHVGSFERRRVIHDGAGLCSLGRWPPDRRPRLRSPRLLRLRHLLFESLDNIKGITGYELEELFGKLASGRIDSCPWPEPYLAGLRDQVSALFDDAPVQARPKPGDVEQPVAVRLLEALLYEADDADAPGMAQFATGVRLGVGARMPRTPAVYERKKRWRLRGQEHGGDEDLEASVDTTWRDNYRSVHLNAAAVEEQVMDHVRRDLAIQLPLDVARRRYPNLSINSLGAVTKSDDQGNVTGVRIVMDGTHGVRVNALIKVLDQDRCPISSDVKRVQREQARFGSALGLALDVRDAHRLPRVRREDWGLQACRVGSVDKVVVYKCGVFGISSIAYWWSRLGGAATRIAHHISRRRDGVWMLLMADDLKLESTTSAPSRPLLLVILLWLLLGIPISWPKIHGGRSITWIGYEVCLRTYSLGVSERRALWAINWLERVERDGLVDIADFRAALGRLSFIAGAIEWEKPFLSPLYAFVSLFPHGGHRGVPVYVRLVCRFIASRLKRRRLYPSAQVWVKHREAFRVDARAEGGAIGIGGWAPVCDDQGRLCPHLSPWFAVELDEKSAPWAFSRGEPYRAIASLEALGALLAVKAFGHLFDVHSEATMLIPGITDNKGNRYALSRLQTTKFPLCIVLMELSCALERLRMRLDLHWTPREHNEEADRLSNLNTEGFDARLRVNLDLETMSWEILPSMMSAGLAFAATPREGRRAHRARPSKRIILREREPLLGN